MVDHLGGEKNAIEVCRRLAGLKEAEIVDYNERIEEKRENLGNIFKKFFNPPVKRLKNHIVNSSSHRTGRAYLDGINFKSTSKRFKNMRAKSRSLEEIMIEMQRTYDEDPRGWGISLGMGKDGYGNIFISGPKGLWQIKVDSIYKPKPIGVGARVGAVDEFKKLVSTKIPPYGFRPITKDQMSRLREGMGRHRPLDEIVGEILSAKPLPLGKLGGPWIAQGPIIHSNFHRYISSKQKELDSKLKRNLDKLLFREGIGGMHY